MRKALYIILFGFLFHVNDLNAQKPKRFSSSEIQLKLQKLNVLGNALYVAAHPDDENTRLITYLANEKKVNTSYFSFTRGDGGQNLIGPEIREELGLIRTQELLAARRIDNGKQYFSRAVDFGYSKHPDETFNIWEKEKALTDLVWVIRNTRPDVIITRFNVTPGTTHGHHTASAILAGEAFELAGDPTKYTEQLTYVEPWQPTSLYWNAYFWRRSEYQKDTSELISYDIGKYNQLLGLSYSEIAALSRSSHRSQGFGATGSRGVIMDYLQFEKGVKAQNDAFEVVDLSWNRVEGGAVLSSEIDNIIDRFNPENPVAILDELLSLRIDISELDDEFWRSKKIAEVDEIIYAVTGLFLEAKANDYVASPGTTVPISIEAINRSNANITLKKVIFNEIGIGSTYSKKLDENKDEQFEATINLPKSMNYSQPYWLEEEHSLGMFTVQNQRLIGQGENAPAVTADFILDINGQELVFTKPVIYKRNDPVLGEVYRPFSIGPPVYVNASGDVVVFTNHASQEIKLDVRAAKDQLVGKVSLQLPGNWRVEPNSYEISLNQKGETQSFLFTVTPPEKQETAIATATVEIGDEHFSYGFKEINYEHIPAQLLFNKAQVKFVKINLEKGSEKVGYLMGAGDNIPDNLRQMGYEVEMINDLDFDTNTLDKYDVIILGVRALNTEDRLKYDMDKLLEFVHRGGNLILQYNTSHRLVTKDFAPFPLTLSRDRVAVEEAEVKIIDGEHPVMNFPNKIQPEDFDNWIQERGLYFPGSWSEEYAAVLSSNDPSEKPLDGGLLITKYGEGYFVYTSYSWFRELPAGVPGAYRLFVNMMSLGRKVP